LTAFDPLAVVRALDEGSVSFVVIGGLAVIVHGYVRATEDTDVLIAPGKENRERVVAALSGLDARRPDGDAFDPERWEPEANLRVETAHGPVDLLHEGAAPLTFAAVAADAVQVVVEDLTIPFAGLASLVAFKRLAGRPQDQADLAALEEAKGSLPMVAVPGLD